MIRIAVDGYEINKNYTGVGRYTFDLLTSMVELDKDIEYTLFLKEESELSGQLKGVKKIVLPSEKGYTNWQNTKLIRELVKGKFDLFFGTNYSLPFFHRGKSVLTVHDISWKVLKDDYSFKERLLKEIKSRISFNKASLIFTVSKFTKNEIVKYYGISEEKIAPIHSAINERFKRVENDRINDFKEKMGIKERKLIGFLGSIFKRRHVKELAEAFKNIRRADNDFALLLIGKIYDNTVIPLLNNPGIYWKERIDDTDINSFYSALDLFVYLSEYEGFGFPPLEALKCETPSLLLNSSSLKELYEDISIFIDKPDIKIIESSILNFFKEKEKNRENILKKFKERENYFKWERAAKEYLSKIKELLNR